MIKALHGVGRMAPAGAALVLLVSCGPDDLPGEAIARTAWVPFRAEFRSIGGGSDRRGRFYRRRDGSIRRETFGADGTAEFVTIENRATRRFYSFSGASWTSQPLTLAPHRAKPPGPDDYSSATPHAATVAGYRVVRADTLLGAMMLRAPSLNYFALAEEHPDPWLRVEYESVVEGDVADALFAPPPDAVIADMPWPHGGQ